MKNQYLVCQEDRRATLTLERTGPGHFEAALEDQAMTLDALELGPGEFHLLQGDRSINVLIQGQPPDQVVFLDGLPVAISLLDERLAARMSTSGARVNRGADGLAAVQAPMPGKVVKCLVAEGDRVKAGQGVIVVEAMKMENELASPVDGAVKKILVQEGQNVDAGGDLVVIG